MSSELPVIVYVHGIGQHKPGFSDPWFEAIQPHLAIAPEKHEVLWSDIVNAKAFLAEDQETVEAITAAEESLRRQIEVELDSRKRSNRQTKQETLPHDAKELWGVGSLSFDDFIRYMCRPHTRSQILSRFDGVVRPLLERGRHIHIVSHSWGTVVSYEGLRQLDEHSFPGRVASLFVLGSALSLAPVRANLFERVMDGRLPTHVCRFINIDAGGDIVGGPISPPFRDVEQLLNQAPTGCPTFFWRRRTARSFVCAHSSYFRPENTAVNRDILARYINQSDPSVPT